MRFFSLYHRSQRLTPCLLTPSAAAARGPELPAAGCHRHIHETGNGFLPLAMPTSLPCVPLVHIINWAPYLLRSRLHSCNLVVEIFAVTISCEGGFLGEWYRQPSLQDVEMKCQSPSPEGKMAKPHLGKRSTGKLLLIYVELKFKQSCRRHAVNCDGFFCCRHGLFSPILCYEELKHRLLCKRAQAKLFKHYY